MLYSNVPFVHGQSPIGEATHPNTLTLKQWMTSPVDFQPAVVINEDEVPVQDFAYGPNSKSTRYKMYNKGIMPTYTGPSLMSFVPAATVQQQVGRGVFPEDGKWRLKKMEREIFESERLRLRDMITLLSREGADVRE